MSKKKPLLSERKKRSFAGERFQFWRPSQRSPSCSASPTSLHGLCRDLFCRPIQKLRGMDAEKSRRGRGGKKEKKNQKSTSTIEPEKNGFFSSSFSTAPLDMMQACFSFNVSRVAQT